MKLNYEEGKVPTKHELVVGGLAYNVPDKKLYTRLIDDTIIQVFSGENVSSGCSCNEKLIATGGIDVPANNYTQMMPLSPVIIKNGDATQVYVKLGYIKLSEAYSTGFINAIYTGAIGSFEYSLQLTSGSTAGSLNRRSCQIRNLTNGPLVTSDFRTNSYAVGKDVVVELYTRKIGWCYGSIAVKQLFVRHDVNVINVTGAHKPDDANLNDALSVTIV